MILKFDHISYSCKQECENNVSFETYNEVFCEKNLLNLQIKKELLECESKHHTIKMLNSSENYPIEITSYPNCNQNGRKYELINGEIAVYTSNPEKTLQYMKNIGFRQVEDNLLQLKPMLDAGPVMVRVIYDERVPLKWFLDYEGFGSLAFVVDNAVKYKRKLEERGIYVTDAQQLCVNGKNLNIFFSISESGEIVEFISLGKK